MAGWQMLQDKYRNIQLSLLNLVISGYKLVVFNLYSFLCYLLEFFSVHRFVIGIILVWNSSSIGTELPYKENR